MRWSAYYIPTLRETPQEAELVSHRLMLRAGLIRKHASGVYSFLPLGYRVIKKIEQIVREEMNGAGALECNMPMVQPRELWEESKRWQYYGPELLRLKDRNMRDFCLGPTHEEVIVDIVRRDVRSYKQLPVTLYQIQTKFRDEIRPRFGVMRAREFSMKDAYSFGADDHMAKKSYDDMKRAYENIFKKAGLRFKSVEADSGAIGGSVSEEFIVLADSGEDCVLSCNACSYAANIERAESRSEAPKGQNECDHYEEVSTPQKRTVEEVCNFLNVSPDNLIKLLVYQVAHVGSQEAGWVGALMRGDHETNLVKLKNALPDGGSGVADIRLATDAEMAALGVINGFIGPVGLKKLVKEKILLLGDLEVEKLRSGVCGGNKIDVHLKGVKPKRDFEADRWVDLRVARGGQHCARCEHGVLEEFRGIEVGHIFKLGTKYSEPMKATFVDEKSVERPFVMGCYGIGIGRTMAAAIEQNHDKDGIVWPSEIAPFDIALLSLNPGDVRVKAEADRLYEALKKVGIDVLYDDREMSPGAKFKDNDLIGIPIRIVVGERGLKKNEVEIKARRSGEVKYIAIDDLMKNLKGSLEHASAGVIKDH